MKVVVALVIDSERRILIARRALNLFCGGLWEFPGGKIVDGETYSSALARELKEELDIDTLSSVYLGEVHDDNFLVLYVYYVDNYRGTACICEDQIGMLWVKLGHLGNFQFPAVNAKVIKLMHEFMN